MKLETLDSVVRGALAAKGYPLHWYVQFMTYAKEVYRDINFDTLPVIKSETLDVSEFKTVDLPCDYVDWARVGTLNGQYLSEFGEKDTFNRLPFRDSDGNEVPPPITSDTVTVYPNSLEGFSFSNYINDKGEHLGRIFNAKPIFPNSFMVIHERNIIQLDASFSDDKIIMDYITDGSSYTACCAVHPYAVKTIQNYIYWQHKRHGRQFNQSEAAMEEFQYYNELGKLRARVFSGELTAQNIIRSLRKHVNGTVKG